MAPLERFAVALAAAVLLLRNAASAYTWPDERIDELEEMLYNLASGPATDLRECGGPAEFDSSGKSGRTNAADWFRTAFHDMATADVSTGIGGLDASIAFEMDRPENVGRAFNDTVVVFRQAHNVRASMSDIIALVTQATVQVCSNGTIKVPYRGGRIDATGAGPAGVPQPQENIASHTAAFSRAGFNVTEMIGLVACGHSLGGVHHTNFPDIAPDLHDPNNLDSVNAFDMTSTKLDNTIAKEFVSNSTQNVLVVGPNVTTRSDLRIFNADGGELMRKMAASPDFFALTCQNLVERMLNTVPRGVQLTEIITPIPVKPALQNIILMPESKSMNIQGSVRILEDGSTSPGRTVVAYLRPRDTSGCQQGALPCGPSQITVNTGDFRTKRPGDPKFTHYSFNFTVPISQGASSLVFEIRDNGRNVLETNGGAGFPINTLVFPAIRDGGQTLSPWTCVTRTPIDPTDPSLVNITLHAKAAVWDDAQLELLTLVAHMPTNGVHAPLVRYGETRATLVKTEDASLKGTGYSIYAATATYPGSNRMPPLGVSYDLVGSKDGKPVANEFFKWNLGQC